MIEPALYAVYRDKDLDVMKSGEWTMEDKSHLLQKLIEFYRSNFCCDEHAIEYMKQALETINEH